MDGRAVMGAIVGSIIDPVVLLIFSAGVFLFTWGLVVFLLNLESSDKRQVGVRHMIWGILGVFIMATVFGIINIVTETFGLGDPTNLNR